MRNTLRMLCGLALFVIPALGQGKRLWVLRAPGEMVEYDPATFAVKQTVKVPPEAMKAPASLAVNRAGQMLFVPAVTLPLTEEDLQAAHKVWVWNGRSASMIDQGVKREVAKTGSNQAVTEIAPAAYLSQGGAPEDGANLYWFANQERRLQREEVDLSVTTTWQAWRTDLSGGAREDVATMNLPDCRCPRDRARKTVPRAWLGCPMRGCRSFF